MAIPRVGLRKIKRKNGYVYQVDYTINGKRIREIVGSNKTEAEAIAATVRTDLIRGKLGVPKKTEKTELKKLFDEFLEKKRKSDRITETSIRRYNNFYIQFEFFITNFFPHCLKDISQIKTLYITESIDRFTNFGTKDKKKWANKTANSYKDFLASLFKFAITQKYIIDNPASGIADLEVNNKRIVKFYKENEIKKILKNTSENWQNFINFILSTGLRQGEMEFLPWEHVDLKDESILIAPYNGWRPKRNKVRTVYLNDSALTILKGQIGKNDSRVFTNDDGSKLYKNQSYKIIKRILVKLGIDGDVHKFRHTFATDYMMSDSGTIYDLAKIMGHDDIETTQIYAHFSPKYLKKRMKNLDKKN